MNPEPRVLNLHTRTTIEVMLSPAELGPLSRRDLKHAVCVVFDILRATTSMITALANGAAAIIPVAGIQDALAIRRQRPDVLLAGEREGLRIRAEQTGSLDFDLGNSPREFTPERVTGRTIAVTTTNGTRALRACAGAHAVLVASFLNLRSTIHWLKEQPPSHLILVCAGTRDEPALEDALAAGAVCQDLWAYYSRGRVPDSAQIVRRLFPLFEANLLEAVAQSANGRRLLAIPELRDDVPYCLQRNTLAFTAALGADGCVRRQA